MVKRKRDQNRETRIAEETALSGLDGVGRYDLAVVEPINKCTWFGEPDIPVARIWRPFHPRIVPAQIEIFHKDSRYNMTTGSNDIRLDKQWTLEDAVKFVQGFFPYVVLVGPGGNSRSIFKNLGADVHLEEMTAFKKLEAPVHVDVQELCDGIEISLAQHVASLAIFDGVDETGFSSEFFPRGDFPAEIQTSHSRLLVRASLEEGRPRYLVIDSSTLAVETIGYHHERSASRLIAIWKDSIKAAGGTLMHGGKQVDRADGSIHRDKVS